MSITAVVCLCCSFSLLDSYCDLIPVLTGFVQSMMILQTPVEAVQTRSNCLIQSQDLKEAAYGSNLLEVEEMQLSNRVSCTPQTHCHTVGPAPGD